MLLANLQKLFKPLRCIHRVLEIQHGDPFLAGLQQHKVSKHYKQVQDALASMVVTQTMLREAFAESLGTDGWGVMQRAFNLMVELYLKVTDVVQLRPRIQQLYLATWPVCVLEAPPIKHRCAIRTIPVLVTL